MIKERKRPFETHVERRVPRLRPKPRFPSVIRPRIVTDRYWGWLRDNHHTFSWSFRYLMGGQ